ncbi:MAG TPA: NAD(P)-dependent oxidoreductase [Microbacteriaceae bacterium]
MKTLVIVTPGFDHAWPLVADRISELLEPVTQVTVVHTEASLAEAVADPSEYKRLIALGVEFSASDLNGFSALEEAYASRGYGIPKDLTEIFESRGLRVLTHKSEGFWAQSVSEFALGLTIGALRRIPQRHHEMLSGGSWDYATQQFDDDPRFTNGTVHGKRVRIVGAGNIASRYASFLNMLGADVAAWDPYASEPSFHRAGSRRELFLDKLVVDAEIFVPMVPLTPSTEGLVTAELIRALPDGCLVVQATRAKICDMPELRRRVVADELSLAADVFDIEPVPVGDPLLGRHNVVHTPHIAGRTKESNYNWAYQLVEQFPEFDRHLVTPPPLLPR